MDLVLPGLRGLAESVQKQRSLFAPLLGERVAADVLTLVDDGRLLDGPGAAPFDAEGVPTRRTELLSAGVLRGFLHNTYTALRGGTRSTGGASNQSRTPQQGHGASPGGRDGSSRSSWPQTGHRLSSPSGVRDAMITGRS